MLRKIIKYILLIDILAISSCSQNKEVDFIEYYAFFARWENNMYLKFNIEQDTYYVTHTINVKGSFDINRKIIGVLQLDLSTKKDTFIITSPLKLAFSYGAGDTIFSVDSSKYITEYEIAGSGVYDMVCNSNNDSIVKLKTMVIRDIMDFKIQWF
jgi:hypothetical protein